jgi:hypothetical protein
MLGAAMKESMKNHTNVISPGSDVASDEIAEFDRDDLEGKPHTLPCIVYRQESIFKTIWIGEHHTTSDILDR